MALVLQKPIHQSKSRLKNYLSSDQRMGLVESMLIDVLKTLSNVSSIDTLGIVTNDPKAILLARKFGFHIFYEKEAVGMNEAIHFVVDSLPDNIQQLFIFPSDIPLISEIEVNNLVHMARDVPVAVIPCRKGLGTNGLILSPPGLMGTAFGENSKYNHCFMAETAGINYSIFDILSLSYDIDTVEDLLLLKELGEGTKTKEYLMNNQIFVQLNACE